MYGMSSKAKKIVNGKEMFVKLESQNKYNAIDTEAGQSGSPLFFEVNDNDSKEEKFAIVGIHIRHLSVTNVNVGVAITNKKIKWINKSLNKFINDMYYQVDKKVILPSDKILIHRNYCI